MDQPLQNINVCSSKQCLVSGACIAAYNLATERLIAVSIATLNSPYSAYSNATNNLICVICMTRAFSYIWSQMWPVLAGLIDFDVFTHLWTALM